MEKRASTWFKPGEVRAVAGARASHTRAWLRPRRRPITGQKWLGPTLPLAEKTGNAQGLGVDVQYPGEDEPETDVEWDTAEGLGGQS